MDATITKKAVTMPDTGITYYGPVPVKVTVSNLNGLLYVETPDEVIHRVDAQWFASIAVYRHIDNLFLRNG